MTKHRTYPHGVPSWVDTDQPDPESAENFYGRLFGWEFTTVSPPGAPPYAIASLKGHDVAGLGATEGTSANWNTYIAVDNADVTAAQVTGAGGRLISGPWDVGPAGRMAICRDPGGAEFRLLQAARRLGAEAVNEPGTWNFSALHTDQPGGLGFYSGLFGWELQDLGFATMVRSPGYGDHLEATVDPGIRARQVAVGAPPGFEDVVASAGRADPGAPPHWHVSFSVGDRDRAADLATELGANVVSTEESVRTRTALNRDPAGVVLTLTQFTPPA